MKERNTTLEIIVTAILALVLGFFLAAGGALDGGGYLGYGVETAATDVYINWLSVEIYLAILLYALMVFLLLILLWRALDWFAAARAQKVIENDNKETRSPLLKEIKVRWFWLCALLLICCWIPFWLALWPGIFNYDAHYQYEMITNAQLQTHHPLLHTFLLSGLVLLGEYHLGGVNVGVELYVGFSMIVLALAFSWMLFTMAEEGAGKALLIGSFLFLAVNPALVVWLVSTNKDVLFTAFFLLASVLLYRACRFRPWELLLTYEPDIGTLPTESPQLEAEDHEPSVQKPVEADNQSAINRKLRIGSAAALALFWLVLAILAFRTSALYSFIVFLPFAAFLIRKKLRVRLMGIMATATLVFVVAYLLLTQVIFMIPSGAWQTLDALSIPRQQLARVWIQTDDPQEIAAFKQIFNEEDREYLNLYEADDADPSRNGFLTPFLENPYGLLDLYLTMGGRHPGTYFDAALLTSYEAWLPGAVTDGYIVEGYFAKPGVDRSSYIDVSAFPPVEEDWILEGFGNWLRDFGLGHIGLDLAPVRLLCSPATYMWILLVALMRTICVRNRRGALVCTFLLVFGLTALLSPLVVMRYYFMIMAATPLLIHIASSPSWQTRHRKSE